MTIHGGAETDISGVHLLHEHGWERQGGFLCSRIGYAWSDSHEALSGQGREWHDVAAVCLQSRFGIMADMNLLGRELSA